MVKKINKKTQMYILLGVILAVITVAAMAFMEHRAKNNVLASIEDEHARLEYFTRYGTHFNLKGSLALSEDLSFNEAALVLRSPHAEYKIPLNYEATDGKLSFAASEYINGGINLEALDLGDYLLLLRLEGETPQGLLSARYYTFDNETAYEGFSYYTLSNEGECNNVVVEFTEGEYAAFASSPKTFPLITVNVKQVSLPDEYCDFVLEVGHGGDDSGAVGYLEGEEITEYEINHDIASRMKALLEEMGYKAELSHYDNTDAPSYGSGGRAVKPNEMKAKYNFSVHSNSHELDAYYGTEVYAAQGSDFTFAKLLADKIVSESGGSYSNQDLNAPSYYSVADGVFVRLFAPENVESTNREIVELGAEAYENIRAYETNYYYMIREIGGIVTGAYVDGRNPEYDSNPYFNSNDVAEPYILEMNYVNNETTLRSLYENPQGYAKGAAEAIDEYVKALKSAKYENIAEK